MITKEKKEKIIKDLSEEAKFSKNIVFLNFRKADTAKTNELRKDLRNKEANYKVAKKTLIKKSLQNSDIKGIFPDSKGETAVIFIKNDDFSDVVKFIFAKTKDGKFKIAGGVFEQEFRDADFVIELSKLPSKQMIYANFISVLASPLRQMVGVFNGGIINFIRVIDQVSKK